MDLINDIKMTIADGKLEKAIEDLVTNFSQHALFDKIIAIRGRYASLDNKIIEGTISTEDISINENRIINSLLRLLNQLDIDKSDVALKNVDRHLDIHDTVVKLLEILNETKAGMMAQVKIRDKLYRTIRDRLEETEWQMFEDFFDTHYAQMNEEELELHQLIREYTKEVINKYNRKSLELILGNEELKTEIPSLLALERHLLVWLGKYEQIFEPIPSTALIYVGPKENVPFPRGIETTLEAYLKQAKD